MLETALSKSARDYAVKCGRAEGRLEVACITIAEAMTLIEQSKPSLAYDRLASLLEALKKVEQI
jgi:hypothetical protein